MNKLVLILISFVTLVTAQVDLTVQYKWDDKVLMTASYIKRIGESRHYIQAGLNFMPSKTENQLILESKNEHKFTFDSYYGLYTGYYCALIPIFRPGLHIGVGYKREARFSKTESETEFVENGYSDWKITPYIGGGLQFGIFSFIVSNEGIGGGINVFFKRD